MQIETKFKVGDLLKHKYSTEHKDMLNTFEVLEIHAQVCYAATQVFYSCRPIMVAKTKEGYGSNATFHWEVMAAFGTTDASIGWQKYREDELIPASEKTINIIKGIKKDE